jgi:hypothetical protein
MPEIDIGDGSFDVDAGTIASGLDLDPSAVPALMKAGEIRSACERGEGADAGRYRLTFFHGDQRFRITVDVAGNILATQNS